MRIENSAKVVYEGPSEGVYVSRQEGLVYTNREVHEAVILDFDMAGNLLGVEVLPTIEDLDLALGPRR